MPRQKTISRRIEGKICKCGCGRVIPYFKLHETKMPDYIKGHGRKNRKNSEEHNQAIREKNKNGRFIICAHCKNEFYAPESHITLGKKYCSKNCYTLAMIGRKLSPETIEKSRLARMGHEVSEKTREKISLKNSGQNNGMWKNGRGYEPHDFNFNRKFKKAIRKRDNYLCMNCGVHNEKLETSLAIHHVNYDKRLTIPENCVSLCRKCHNLTNINREYWTKLFQDKMSRLYGYGYSDSSIVLEFNSEGEAMKGGM